ncbi:MAG: hypothetical protein GXP18_08965 [Gammaproteobacteria bacterium]|nr:hypothetical protein [Gammaproteobacteria bacterium]
MQGAQARVDAAQARSDGADRPLHNPSLGLDAERTDINTSIIGLTQTLDWSDKQGALVNMVHWSILPNRNSRLFRLLFRKPDAVRHWKRSMR